MSIQWAGLAPELMLAFGPRREQPLGAQLESELRDAIRSGRLAVGERLPSSRELARELGVSRGLVQECYAPAAGRGLPQRENRVGHAGGRAARERRTAAPPPSPGSAAAARRRLPAGTPDLTSFPRRDWMWAMREAMPHRAGGPRLRRPARRPPPARGARRLPAAGTRGRRRPGADRGLRRLRPGDQPRPARARRRGLRAVAFEDPGLQRPRRARRPATWRRRRSRSTQTASTSTRSPPPARGCC